MKKRLFLPFGLLILVGLSGCGPKKQATVQNEEQDVQEAKQMKPQPIKQARTSGTHPKEVGFEDEDYA